MAMRVGVERGRNGGKGRKGEAGAVAAIFFIWLILVVSRMRLSSAASKEVNGRMLTKSTVLHRKTHIFETEEVFKPPAGFKVHGGGENDDVTDIVYEDDKRVIHTGPNPLHN